MEQHRLSKRWLSIAALSVAGAVTWYCAPHPRPPPAVATPHMGGARSAPDLPDPTYRRRRPGEVGVRPSDSLATAADVIVHFTNCRVWPEITEVRAYVTDQRDSSKIRVATVQINSGNLRIPLALDLPEYVLQVPGAGVLAVPGYQPVQVTWVRHNSAGITCLPDPIVLRPASTFVEGVVRGVDGGVVVQGCGGFTETAEDGSFSMEVLAQPHCAVRARRVDKLPGYWGDPADVTVRSGSVTTANPVLPPAVYGGLGARLASGPLGPSIVYHGRTDGLLATGDVLLRVRDVPVSELELSDVAGLVRGEPGEIIEVVLSRDGAVVEVSLELLRVQVSPWPEAERTAGTLAEP